MPQNQGIICNILSNAVFLGQVGIEVREVKIGPPNSSADLGVYIVLPNGLQSTLRLRHIVI